MKYKNIGFFEYHVEKFILAIGLIVALLIFWNYVWDNPYHATLRFGMRQETLAPEDVEEQIANQAKQLDTKISRPEPNIEPIDVPEYTQEFRKRLVETLILPRQLPTTLGQPGIDPQWLHDETVHEALPQLALPEPPAPKDLEVRKSFAVLDREKAAPGVVDMVRPVSAGPLDFLYVSVKGTFFMDEWKDKLRRGPQPRIPEDWWKQQLALTGVQLERQTLDSRTGQWGPVEVIPQLPNQVSFHGIEQQFTQPEATEAIRTVHQAQEQVTKPQFVPLAGGEEWLPPGSVVSRLTPQQRERKQQLEQQIEQLKRELGMVEEGPTSRPGPGPLPIQEPGQFIRPEEEITGGGLGGNRATGRNQRVTAARSAQEARQTARQRRELQSLQEELDQLLMQEQPAAADQQQPQQPGQQRRPAGLPPHMRGDVPPGIFGPEDGFDPTARPQGAQDGAPQDDANANLAPPEPIDIWAHDLTAQPGETYRYRLRVGVLNPLFNRGARLNEEQAEREQFRLSHMGQSEESASEWTEPVQMPAERMYFIVEADPNSKNATVEVWRIFNGQWQYHTFTVAPGDRIGGTVSLLAGDQHVDVDMAVNAVLVDLTFDRAGGGMAGNNRSAEALLMSERDGRLFSRSIQEDEADEERRRLLQSVRRDAVAQAGDHYAPQR